MADHINKKNPSTLSFTSIDDFISKSYDYIIVGGGTAGLVLAARLTEDPSITVGVIEAGRNHINDPLVDIPAMFMQMLGNKEYDWNFMTEPQEGNQNKIHNLNRGKMLGGSSGLNFMLYSRGSKADYDDWSTLADDPTWSWDNIKPYMLKHQTLDPLDDSIPNRGTKPFLAKNHGTSGPIHTSFQDTYLGIEPDIIRAADAVTGIKRPVDPWSGNHVGFANYMGQVARQGPNKGKRSYAARDYFHPNQDRPNLHLICESLATKVLLEEGSSSPAATGVEFSHADKTYVASARREVLICCGVIKSPQLLELSGIGDAAVLEAAGVPLKVMLPGVGANFQDHVLTGTAFELQPGNVTLDGIWDPVAMDEAQTLYKETKGGPLTALSSSVGFFPWGSFATKEERAAAIASIRTTQSESGTSEFYKRQLDCVIGRLEDEEESATCHVGLVPGKAGMETCVQDQSTLFSPREQVPGMKHWIILSAALQYPISRGMVHINSSDPTKPPTIDPAYLTHPADVIALSSALRMTEKMVNNEHLKPKIHQRVVPPTSVNLHNADEAAGWIREWCMGQYHPCGTCAMGEVLDGKLRVKGVRGLRVCDASVFPNHVSGNICSSVYAVAEKAADIIKEEW